MKTRICVVIPTKNEQKTIEQIIHDIQKTVRDLSHELAGIIVTDDSKDQTRKIAKSLGATIVIGEGKGLGYAMFKGLKTALSLKPDIIVSMDGDGQTDLAEMKRFIDPVINDEADMVIGSRFKEKGLVYYNYRWANRLGIHILVRILRYLTKLPLTDSHGGLRAMTPDVVHELEMIGTFTYVQETIIDACEKGFRVKEISSAWKPRQEGKSRVVSSNPVYVFYTLPVLILRSGHHIKALYPMGLFFIFLSIFDFIFVAVQTHLNWYTMFSRRSFDLIFLFLSTGLNLFFIGFSLELINRVKCRLDKLDYKNRL